MPIRDEPKSSEPLYYLTYGSGLHRWWIYIKRINDFGASVEQSRTALDATALTYNKTQTLTAIIVANNPSAVPYALPCDSQALIPPDLRRIINVELE